MCGLPGLGNCGAADWAESSVATRRTTRRSISRAEDAERVVMMRTPELEESLKFYRC
jgi:hypothetical protein